MRVGVAHPGTQHSWQTALAFQEAGELTWYATSYYFKRDAWPDRWLTRLPGGVGAKIARELNRRRFDPLQDELVRRAIETEFLERPLRSVGLPALADDLMTARHRRFPARVAELIQREPVDALWATHDSLDVFRKSKTKGVLCVMDQPSWHLGAMNAVIREEHERHPAWFAARQAAIPQPVIDAQNQAAEMADLIVVGSASAAASMVRHGTDPAKLRVIPYGFDARLAPSLRPSRAPLDGRPVQFLFVGRVGAMKGLAYLLEAFSRIDPKTAQLTIVGPLDIPPAVFAANLGPAKYLGQARRQEVYRHMQQADCLILPSLFEGGGIVLYEGAACGLGIVQSDRCGDGVRTPENGEVLTDISADAIEASVRRACEPDRLNMWQENSWAMRQERDWSVYRRAARRLIETRGGGA